MCHKRQRAGVLGVGQFVAPQKILFDVISLHIQVGLVDESYFYAESFGFSFAICGHASE